MKIVLMKLGIKDYLTTPYRQFLDYRFRRRYGGITRFHLNLEAMSVCFSTEDDRSKRWFFPRYDGGGIHEEPVTRLITQQLKSATCFADVGTFLGYYTCIAAKLMSGGTVYAFEMDAENYALLEKNLELNVCRNVHAFRLAVADAPGTVTYIRGPGRPSAAFGLSPGVSGTEEGEVVPVQAITLDDFFHGRESMPDLMKIDVEGAEMKVLKGMTNIMEEHGPKLFVEVHPRKLLNFHSSAGEVIRALLDLGYQVHEIVDMRGPGEKVSLRGLNRESLLMSNTMLYAYRE